MADEQNSIASHLEATAQAMDRAIAALELQEPETPRVLGVKHDIDLLKKFRNDIASAALIAETLGEELAVGTLLDYMTAEREVARDWAYSQTRAFISRTAKDRDFIDEDCIAEYSDKHCVNFVGEQLDEFDLKVLEALLTLGKGTDFGKAFTFDVKDLVKAVLPHCLMLDNSQIRAFRSSLERLMGVQFAAILIDKDGKETLRQKHLIENIDLSGAGNVTCCLTDVFADDLFFPSFGNLIQHAFVLIDPKAILSLALAVCKTRECEFAFELNRIDDVVSVAQFRSAILNACERLWRERAIESYDWQDEDDDNAFLTLYKFPSADN